MKQIGSIQNPLVKNIIKLQEKSRERKKQGLFIIEGQREIELALKGKYTITTLLWVTNKVSKDFIQQIDASETIEISQEVYDKLAYRESTEGVLALAKTKQHTLEDLEIKENPLILVVESIEKPGNIGAMLRTADAANIDAFIIANPKTDVYNSNVIRSSIGCLFTNQIALGSSEEIIAFLKNKNIDIYSATLQNSNIYCHEDYTNPSAVVVGTEATGLSQVWRSEATQNINIPMEGQIDSMNVSVAAAILLFEAKRQRNITL